MVNRLIALNTKHFSDKQKNNRGYAETQTGEQLDELLRQEWLRRDVADIRAGKEEKKDWPRGFHLYDMCGYRQSQTGASGLRESLGGEQGRDVGVVRYGAA